MEFVPESGKQSRDAQVDEIYQYDCKIVLYKAILSQLCIIVRWNICVCIVPAVCCSCFSFDLKLLCMPAGDSQPDKSFQCGASNACKA